MVLIDVFFPKPVAAGPTGRCGTGTGKESLCCTSCFDGRPYLTRLVGCCVCRWVYYVGHMMDVSVILLVTFDVFLHGVSHQQLSPVVNCMSRGSLFPGQYGHWSFFVE